MNEFQKIQVVRVKAPCCPGFGDDLSASGGSEMANDDHSSDLVYALTIDIRTLILR